jgi:tetratricopeptide (TPR) repeat protein
VKKYPGWRVLAGLGVPVAFCVFLLLISCGSQNDFEGDPTDLIAQGWEYLTIQEYDQASDHFRSALDRVDAASREHALALYGLGCAARFRRPEPDLKNARGYFERVVEEDTTGEIAPWGALALARLDFIHKASLGLTEDLMTDEALRDSYRRVIRNYPGTDAASEATLHLAQSLFASQDGQEAIEAVGLLEGLLADDPGTPYRYAIEGALAGYYYHQERYLEQYEAMVRQGDAISDPDRYMGDVYYRIAFHADARLDRPDLALPYYEKILEECKMDPRSYQVERAVERLREATGEAGAGGRMRRPGVEP